MARNFVRASSQYMAVAAAAASGVPLTLAGWFKTSNASNHQDVIAILDSDGSDYFELALRGDAGQVVRAETSDGLTPRLADTTAGYTSGVWQHACAVFASSSSRFVYLNGGNKGTNAATGGPDEALTVTAIGRRNLIATTEMDGQLAEVAVWNVALTDAEVVVLATGASPRFVRPSGLVAYWPLIGRASVEPDLRSGLGLTNVGTTQADHPRVYLPGRRRTVFVDAGAPPAPSPSNNLLLLGVG